MHNLFSSFLSVPVDVVRGSWVLRLERSHPHGFEHLCLPGPAVCSLFPCTHWHHHLPVWAFHCCLLELTKESRLHQPPEISGGPTKAAVIQGQTLRGDFFPLLLRWSCLQHNDWTDTGTCQWSLPSCKIIVTKYNSVMVHADSLQLWSLSSSSLPGCEIIDRWLNMFAN